MTKTARLALTLLTALTLSACQPSAKSAATLGGDSGATFRIYSVLQGANEIAPWITGTSPVMTEVGEPL